jgi:hypothetical protein
MRAALLAAVLAMGCRIDLDDREVSRACKVRDDISVCREAADHSDFTWIQDNILSSNCAGKQCHGLPEGAQTEPDGKIVLAKGMAYAALLGPNGTGAESDLEPGRLLVVPTGAMDPEHPEIKGRPDQSYLFFLMRGVLASEGAPPFAEPPDDIGYMPMDNNTLCCQKIDAVRRWIEAGAPP